MKMIDIKAVGVNIADIRRKNNLTQEQLAELAGLSTNYIARVERGEIQNFSAINMLRIAAALDVSIDELAEGAHEKEKLKSKPHRKELNKLLDQMGHETSELLSQSFIKTIHLIQDNNSKHEKSGK
jgi:transcriptional regulator with XRE-family HTH domain